MRKILMVIMIGLNILLVMCSEGEVTDSEINEMKEITDVVLSYDGDYDDTVNSYIAEQLFYEANYVVFYSFWVGDVILTKYDSEITGITKENNKYNLCMVINMEGEATTLEVEGDESGYDTVEGSNVPVEIELIKKNGSYYIENIVEYESLEKAKESNSNFDS